MAELMLVQSECECNREIQSVVPWNEGFSNGSNYVRCKECGHINDVATVGEFK